MRSFLMLFAAGFLLIFSLPGMESPCFAQQEEKKKTSYAYCVMVYPKSGNKYEAIIRDEALIAHIEAHETLDPKKFDPSTRITLYYMRGMNGSMGIRLKDVTSIAGLMPLSKKDYSDMEKVIGLRIKKVNEKEEVRLEDRKKKLAKKKKEQEAALEQKRLEQEALARKKSEMDKYPLLKRYPPGKGWGPAMKEELERRMIVIKVFPKPEEQAFLDNFSQWQKQFEEWKSAQETEKKKEIKKAPSKGEAKKK